MSPKFHCKIRHKIVIAQLFLKNLAQLRQNSRSLAFRINSKKAGKDIKDKQISKLGELEWDPIKFRSKCFCKPRIGLLSLYKSSGRQNKWRSLFIFCKLEPTSSAAGGWRLWGVDKVMLLNVRTIVEWCKAVFLSWNWGWFEGSHFAGIGPTTGILGQVISSAVGQLEWGRAPGRLGVESFYSTLSVWCSG